MPNFTDAFIPGRPYWWEGVAWPELDAVLPDQVDLLVIGAGYTGLSAAIAAHDAGAKVAVVEAGEPGQGASSRNGGMVGAHPRLGWDVLARRFGAPVADAIFAEAAPALDWLKDLIRREKIACDFEQTGRVQLAHTPGHFETQKALVARINEKSRVPCRLLQKDDLGSEIATDLYCGGLLFSDHGALHPARFHLGLLNAVLGRGIPVVSQCRAEGTEPSGSGFEVATAKGRIIADKVILATNGYTTKPYAWFAARVFPVPSYLLATEPLAPDVIARLAPGRRMMVETRARHSYYRLSPDGTRILFGGRASLVNIDLRTAGARLVETLCQIWPDLEGVKLSHVWTGNTGYSFGHMPSVGVHDGLHFAMGYSGSGTVMAPYLGAKAALSALGAAGSETAYSRIQLAGRWFHRGGTPTFLTPADIWYRAWVDRREARLWKSGR